ncbi:MAG: multicopper oxidase domain-containing protein [Phycisphaeraceae bacterium]|nr:multicopper oxidase domain-containing protein [Phycisphaeraceae bacterium]
MKSRQILLAVWAVLGAMLAVGRSASAETFVVYVYNNQFSVNQPGGPIAHPTITVGDTVQWVWLQGNHTTTSVQGSMEVWNQPISSSSTTFSRTFTHLGTHWYYCIPHGFDNLDGTAGGMHGTVTVLSAGVGACCMPGGACMETTEAGCLSMGGVFQGVLTACSPDPCGSETVTIEVVAGRDNVLYETVDGSVSNALGSFLYVGNQNSGAKRRSAVRFGLDAIPPGATVISAEARLFCNQSSGATFAVTLQRLLSDWGEGTSVAGGNEGSGGAATAGDATWLHTFWPTQFWTLPGGDFAPSVSASVNVSAQGVFYTWTGEGIKTDVQHWVNHPAMNFGWIMRGDEASSANSKRFLSRDSAMTANRPRLIVTYLPPPPPPPTGACCMTSGMCEVVTEHHCHMHGGVYQGNDTTCGSVECAVVLTPFVDPLPRPGVAQPVSGQAGGAAHYEIAMTEQFQQLHRDLPPTRVWGYAGSYPGPTIEAFRDQPVTVTWINDLRVFETGTLRTTHTLAVDECLHGPDVTGQVPVAIVHLHGGKVPPDSDGYPDDAFPPGAQSPVYNYPNIQPAGTLWYHDHALGITRLNVMMGLAGFYLLRDSVEQSLGLPSGEYEVPLAIQDRSFRADGSLRYHDEWHEHFFGDTVLVNGKVWPYLDVDRGKYRFRLLNGSNSRTYRLALSDGGTFWQIGTDLGLMSSPTALTSITLLPGERAEVIIDFAGYAPGTEIVLTNSAPAPFPGFPGVGVIPNVMKFVVGAEVGHTASLPGSLATITPLDPAQAVIERVLDLRTAPNVHCPNHHGAVWTIDGLMWDDITEFPKLGDIEIWTWRNNSGISHPMHMHLVAFQVLNRQAIDDVTGEPTGPLIPPTASEVGWKDTVDAPPGYYTRVITKFEGFTGLFPYHCHILEHEDHEMMRQFRVVCPGDYNNDGVVDLADLLDFLGAWNPNLGQNVTPGTNGDVNNDGVVDLADLLEFLGGWNPHLGQTCP